MSQYYHRPEEEIHPPPPMGDPQPISMRDLDGIGFCVAGMIAQYWAECGCGPTWHAIGDVFTWDRAMENWLFPQLRVRGWIDYTSEMRSLVPGWLWVLETEGRRTT
jgi:hypothetical protein